ncbi:MAG: aspartate--tRNA ligase, partial [bacterium]
LEKHQRTHYCHELSIEDVGKEVVLFGWVNTRRDHGGLIFVDLRDRFGVTQVVFHPEMDPRVHELGHHLRTEYCLGIKGKVNPRPEGMTNYNLKTGEIDVDIIDFEVFSRSKTPPFLIEDDVDVHEEIRLKHRYLDLRRNKIKKNMVIRSHVCHAVRNYFNEHKFIEVETPFLTKSTPEGARDYLVPSRVQKGSFYALPQSPQIFKQLLMVSGLDRYYQIVKCFRDEDLRADRQPEFTQIDVEMSFITQDIIFNIMEGMISRIWYEIKGIAPQTPFPRMTYEEAMERYGLDAPDTRFGLELTNVTSIFTQSNFKVFNTIANACDGSLIKAINFKGGAELPRSQIDALEKIVKVYGAKGLAYIRVTEKEWVSPIVKFFTEEEKAHLVEQLHIEVGDVILFGAGSKKIVNDSLGHLREHLGETQGLIDPDKDSFVWVVDFPMFEYDEDAKRYVAVHHPFTAPKTEDLALLDTDPGKCRANAYDLVLNGHEIGGGSIRIHQTELQSKVFSLLGISEERAQKKFGFLLDALQYGPPPHGGIAFGLDRIIMLLAGINNIRDVIAFPKTQKASCLMSECPSSVDAQQLLELGLKVIVQE